MGFPRIPLPSIPLPGIPLPGISLPDVDVDIPGILTSADRAFNERRLDKKIAEGTLHPAIQPYMGWWAQGVARLTARVTESPNIPEPSDDMPLSETVRQTLRRFTTAIIPDAEVKATIAGSTATATSDSSGYVEFEVETGKLTPGWHVMDLEADINGTLVRAMGRVLVPDPKARVAIISDIDDTILKTGLTQGFTAARRTFFRDVTGRRPVRGMPALYQGLERGVSRKANAPFFYVSTGSWNMYDYLESFLSMQRLPMGPMFLTDWGPTSQRLMRDGREHKRTTIRKILTAYPDFKFVLIGDVGQGDPETYEVMMREFGDQVIAAMVIYVGSHLKERTEEIAERAIKLREEEGLPFFYIPSAVDAVGLMWQMRLVDRQTTVALAEQMGN